MHTHKEPGIRVHTGGPVLLHLRQRQVEDVPSRGLDRAIQAVRVLGHGVAVFVFTEAYDAPPTENTASLPVRTSTILLLPRVELGECGAECLPILVYRKRRKEGFLRRTVEVLQFGHDVADS